ncbi:MAG: CoA ester lyase [Anaerolineae bacterium]
MNVRRALLFMPGDDRRKIEKGAALGVDSIIMDLEDGVALNAKAAARDTIAAALREVEFGRTEKLVRINPVSREHFPEDDLALTLPGRPNGIVIPKVEAAWQVAKVAERLSAAERHHGWDEGEIVLLALVETALGVANVRDIAENAPRLAALIFGAEDLAGDMGAVRTAAGHEMMFARSSVVLHAKAFGVQAIDTPFVDLTDEDGLIRETTTAVEMGYTGKLAIHPKQVEPIQKVFTPSNDQIYRAIQLIRAHESQQAAGSGVFVLDGKMVDRPMVRAAQAVIDRAHAAGIDVETLP